MIDSEDHISKGFIKPSDTFYMTLNDQNLDIETPSLSITVTQENNSELFILTEPDTFFNRIALRKTMESFSESHVLGAKFLSNYHSRDNLEEQIFDLLITEKFRLPVQRFRTVYVSRIAMTLTK